MPEPLITIPLAKDWIARLWQQWSTIRDSRHEELEEIKSLFGNPELLAPYYVEPDCQWSNPADHHEEEALDVSCYTEARGPRWWQVSLSADVIVLKETV